MVVGTAIVAAIVAFILYTVGSRFYRFHLFRQRVNTIPGPTFRLPFFGMVLQLMGVSKEARLDWFHSVTDRYKDGYCRTWIGTNATVHVRKPEHVEVILRSNTEITKSQIYDYLMPWLGRGLLTATGDQWFHSRKLLTPAFHFSILEEFAEVMTEKVEILTNCIEREIEIHGDEPFDIFELGVKAALDIICETAMGVDVHAQEAIQSPYISAVHTISEGATQRFFRPWLKPNWLFYRTAAGKEFNDAVQEAHDLCTRVIERKRRERKLGCNANDVAAEDDGVTGKRKKKAFLDLLLEANEKAENPLTIEEIRDETNTFMFAGHDTTGALVSWALFSIGNELEVQRKIHEELDRVLGDADDNTVLKQLPNLKYLERVIKEVLRLYPSATVISRKLMGDISIGNYVVPKGTTLAIQIYQLHRDSSVWPDPLRFDPDRFLPENVKGRHPYAYIPFSAGPRNCIGQKYAMLEAKLTLARVLQKFSVKSVESHSTIKKYSEIILRPADGVYVRMRKRSDRDEART